MGKGARNRGSRAPVGPSGKATIEGLAASGANRGAVARVVPLAELAQLLTAESARAQPPWAGFQELPRNPRDLGNFGPLTPLVPAPLDPVRPDTKRPDPRLTQYPVGWNIELDPNRLLSWETLRGAAEYIDIIRAAIEVRKRHLRELNWSFRITKDAVAEAREAKGDGKASDEDIEKELRQEHSATIKRLTTFLRNPWRQQGLTFGTWLNNLMENYIVYDARVVHPAVSYGGEVLGLEIIDPTTIKPLIDDRGGRPASPYPAYQQILYGFPRGEWTADVEEVDNGDGTATVVMNDGYASDQLGYFVENVRSHTPYGFSDVEQALIAAKVYLARQGWMLAEYTEGSTPDTWLFPQINNASGLQANVSMTPTERNEFENALNAELSGQTGERKKIRLAPPGMTAMQMTQEAERYKPEYDLFLIKTVLKHLGVTATELGFSESQGLGASGLHEGQEAVTGRVGTRPDVAIVEEMINEMACRWLGCPDAIEFAFSVDEQEDAAADDALETSQLVTGRRTLNELRRKNGQAPYDFPEADRPMFVQGATAVMVDTIEAAAQAAQQQAAITAEGGAVGNALTGAKVGETEAKTEQIKNPPAPAKVAKAAGMSREEVEACRAEEVAYGRWLRRQAGRPPKRPFEFSPLMLKFFGDVNGVELPSHSIVKAAGGGDDDPKGPAPDRRWPGWEKDEQVAESVARKLIRQLLDGLGIRSLIDRVLEWAGLRKPGKEEVAGFLRADPASQAVHDAVGNALRAAYEQGYMVGNRSARAVGDFLAAGGSLATRGGSTVVPLPGVPTVDWANWVPGDEEAARLVLSADGTDVALQALLDRDQIRIKGIAETQIDMLAAVLADGLELGKSPDEIGRAVRGLVSDPKAAYRIAVTETNRAVSAATLDSYRGMGLATKQWMSAFDQRVCKICAKNAKQGEIELDERFESGELAPPGHPHCRCALAPGHVDLDDTSWLDELDEEMGLVAR